MIIEMATKYKPTEEVEGKEGYVRDYITGKLVRARPEETDARQIFGKRLVEEYGYLKEQIQTVPEFYIHKGSQRI